MACRLEGAGQRAPRVHWAHALVTGVHTLCCGLPFAAGLLAMTASGASSFAFAADQLGAAHRIAHHFELWTLAFSAVLVAVGIAAEWGVARRGRRVSVMMAASCGFLILNATLVLTHHLA